MIHRYYSTSNVQLIQDDGVHPIIRQIDSSEASMKLPCHSARANDSSAFFFGNSVLVCPTIKEHHQ
jgi:hypothetical protein